MRYDRGEEELYDLRTDANEMTNVLDVPAYASVAAELRRLWREYEGCVGPQCRRDLPADLRAGPADNAELTSAFWAQVAARAAASLTR